MSTEITSVLQLSNMNKLRNSAIRTVLQVLGSSGLNMSRVVNCVSYCRLNNTTGFTQQKWAIDEDKFLGKVRFMRHDLHHVAAYDMKIMSAN